MTNQHDTIKSVDSTEWPLPEPPRTHLVVELFPYIEASRDHLRSFACDVLSITNQFTRDCKMLVNIEPHGMQDLLDGLHPRPLWARVYAALNPKPGEYAEPTAPREPSFDDVENYKHFWGGMISRGSVTLLIPYPDARPDLQLNFVSNPEGAAKYGDALHDIQNLIAQLPCDRINREFGHFGTAFERVQWARANFFLEQ
jgi:hypothetical protein